MFGKSVRVVASCPASGSPVSFLGLLDLEYNKIISVVTSGTTQQKTQRYMAEELALLFLTFSVLSQSIFRRVCKIYEKRLLDSSCLSVYPHGKTRFPLDGFWWNSIFENFRKSVKKIQVSLKSDKNEGYFTWRPIYITSIYQPTNAHIISYKTLLKHFKIL